MKYSREERLAIGKRIYDGEFSVQDASEVFDVSYYTARDYLRAYKAFLRTNPPAGNGRGGSANAPAGEAKAADMASGGRRYKTYLHSLSRSELEAELIKMKRREEQIRRLLK